MATLEEIYDAVLSDENQRLAFVQAANDSQGFSAFLKECGCDAAPEEARAFLHEKLAEGGELSAKELGTVSGAGLCDSPETPCPECQSLDTYAESLSTWRCRSCGKSFEKKTNPLPPIKIPPI